MAAEEIKYLGQPGTERLIANLREEISTGDEAQAGALAEHKNDSSVHVAAEEKEALLGAIAHVHEHNNKEVLDNISSVVDIYTQADEPVDAIDGSIWFNTGNADGTISILVRRNGSWEISSDGVAQVQPDWDETDASNPGYIRNKPFGYTADLYANSTLPFAVGTNKNNIYSASLPTELFSSLKEGDNVTVVWDGTVYELTAKSTRVTDYFTVNNGLGNGRILSESYGANLATDTGEPFIIAPAFHAIYTRSTMSTHSLQIKDDEMIVKIDAKFLPDEALNASVQSDWNETDESSAAFIVNKPEIPDTDNFATKEYVQEQLSGVSAPDMTGYAKSEDIPTTVSELENDAGYLTEQVQPDWDETDTTSPAYIKNKPVISGDGSVSTGFKMVVSNLLGSVEIDSSDSNSPVIDLDFAAYLSGGSTIPNNGTLGSYGAATVTLNGGTASYSADDDYDPGIVLTNKATFTIPMTNIATTINSVYTWVIGVSDYTVRDISYCRICRGNNDFPSVFYYKARGAFCAKLFANCTTSSVLSYNSDICTVYSDTGLTFPIAPGDTLAFTCDGSVMRFYINGTEVISMSSEKMSTSSIATVGGGDTSNTSNYYMSNLKLSKFMLYDRCLTAEELMEVK